MPRITTTQLAERVAALEAQIAGLTRAVATAPTAPPPRAVMGQTGPPSQFYPCGHEGCKALIKSGLGCQFHDAALRKAAASVA